MRKGMIMSLVAGLALMMVVSVASAQGPGGGPGYGPGYKQQKGDFGQGPRIGREQGPRGFFSNLSPEKQEAVKKIMDEYRAQAAPRRAELKARKAELEWRLSDPATDQKTIDALVDQINDLRGKQFKERVAHQQKLAKETGVYGFGMGGGHGRGGRGGGSCWR